MSDLANPNTPSSAADWMNAIHAHEAPPVDWYFSHSHYDPDKAAQGAKKHGVSWWNRAMVNLMPLAPKPLVWPIAKRYVAGDTMRQMIETVKVVNGSGCSSMINLLGEHIHHIDEAKATAKQYHLILEAIEHDQLHANITIKPSSLGLSLDKSLCADLYSELLVKANQFDNFIRIEMEESSTTDDTLALYRKLRQQHSNTGIVLQAYLRRSHDDMLALIQEGLGHIRLVKGIYLEPRWLAYTDPATVNNNYVAMLEAAFAAGAYVGIATHDEALVWHALKLIRQYNLTTDKYEFQMLMGVDTELRHMLTAAGHHVRVYVPYGHSWYTYSIRRFKENPHIARHVLNQLLHPGR